MAMEHGPHILITRPSGQHQQFAQDCQALGFRVSHLPCLAIKGIENKSLRADFVATADSILFTSKNAVEYAHALLPLPWDDVAVQAIGPATSKALSEKGQTMVREPNVPYNSEAFLAQMDLIPAGRLIIIKGAGGRSCISDSLSGLGWHVDTLDVYKRLLPSPAPGLVDKIFSATEPDIISVGSNETLSNLMLLTGDLRPTVLRSQLLVNSIRCADLAETLGFEYPAIIAQSAGDQGQLTMLKQWQQFTFRDSIE